MLWYYWLLFAAGIVAAIVFSHTWHVVFPPLPFIGFIDRTGLGKEVLRRHWREAQEEIATKNFEHGGGLVAQPNPAALDVKPRCIIVTTHKADPGTQPLGWRGPREWPVAGCTEWANRFWPRVTVLRENPELPLTYEFENVIVAKLGYNTLGR